MRRTGILAVIMCLGAVCAESPSGSDKEAKVSGPKRSLYMTGAAVGYLLPVSGSYSYEKESGALLNPTYSTESPDRILRISMLNLWQFDNLLLETDGFVGLLPDRFLIGGDMSLSYLFGKRIIAPYAGGGVGIHYGPVDDGNAGDKLYTSPALMAQGGLLLFRGYDVNVVLRAQYVKVLAGDRDGGIVVDGGVVYDFQSFTRASGR